MPSARSTGSGSSTWAQEPGSPPAQCSLAGQTSWPSTQAESCSTEQSHGPPQLAAAVADGAALPVRSAAVDLICFAQAWHWLDESRRVPEVHRVLVPGGRWAGWWSHPRADREPWFDRYWNTIENSCPGTHRGQRDTDWGTTVAAGNRFDVGNRITVPWTREISVDDWMTDQQSHSYVAGLPPTRRSQLLADLRAVLDEQFPDSAMSVRYETWLWVATRL